MDTCKYWGQWKSRMANDHIFRENPIDHLPEKFADVITQKEWTAFVEQRTSDEAMEMRRRNVKNQKEAQRLHHIGRADYIDIEDVVVRLYSLLFEFYTINHIIFHIN